MLGKREFHVGLFTLDISRIPPAYFAESIQVKLALGFTWEAKCGVLFVFGKNFLAALVNR